MSANLRRTTMLFVLLLAGCSNNDATRARAVPTSTTVAPATTITSTVPPPATTTSRPLSTASTASTSPPTPTTSAAGPAVAQAGGWRLAISQPAARATIGPNVTLCYEATGTSREPDLALEVTVVPPGTTSRVPVAVGRGTARFDLSGAGLGPRDLRVQLIADGQRIDGLAVTIPVTIAAGAGSGACP